MLDALREAISAHDHEGYLECGIAPATEGGSKLGGRPHSPAFVECDDAEASGRGGDTLGLGGEDLLGALAAIARLRLELHELQVQGARHAPGVIGVRLADPGR